MVAAAVPRELRIDPREKKKAASLGPRRHGALMVVVVDAGLIGMRGIALSSSSPGKPGRSSQKRFGFCQKMGTNWS